jgi:hypothetical protein
MIKIDKIWEMFNEETEYISENQLILLNKIIPSRKVISEILESYKVKEEKELKHYMFVEITEKYFKISNEEKEVLIKYFKNELYEKLIKILPEYEEIIDKEKNKNKSMLLLINKYDMKKIYLNYPDLNYIKLNIKYGSRDYPIDYNKEYEYGYQYIYENRKKTNKKLYYLRLYEWCCFDLDNIDNSELYEIINKYLTINIRGCVGVYKTNKGYHIHIMDRLIEYNSKLYMRLSKILKNDPLYFGFVRNNGYKLRLSKKNEEEEYISKFIGYYGNKENIDEKCKNYKELYDMMIYKHNKIDE